MRRIAAAFLVSSLSIALAVGCRAQVPPAGQELNRRIEVQVRSQLNLPQNYNITIGARTKSEFAGYDSLPITFSKGPASKTLTFLISQDNHTLIRMDKIDLAQDPASEVSTAGRPFRGGKDAKVTIVVFDDLECQFCARMHRELFPETLQRYGDKIRVIYKDFPLPAELHPWAMRAAVDSSCLAKANGDAYWNYVDFVHDHHSEIAGDAKDPKQQLDHADQTLDRLAREEAKKQKADSPQLEACLTSQDMKAVTESMHEGDNVGVEGTPLMLVNGEKINGWVDTDTLWPVIDRALREAGEQPPPSATPAPSAKQGQ